MKTLENLPASCDVHGVKNPPYDLQPCPRDWKPKETFSVIQYRPQTFLGRAIYCCLHHMRLKDYSAVFQGLWKITKCVFAEGLLRLIENYFDKVSTLTTQLTELFAGSFYRLMIKTYRNIITQDDDTACKSGGQISQTVSELLFSTKTFITLYKWQYQCQLDTEVCYTRLQDNRLLLPADFSTAGYTVWIITSKHSRTSGYWHNWLLNVSILEEYLDSKSSSEIWNKLIPIRQKNFTTVCMCTCMKKTAKNNEQSIALMCISYQNNLVHLPKQQILRWYKFLG